MCSEFWLQYFSVFSIEHCDFFLEISGLISLLVGSKMFVQPQLCVSFLFVSDYVALGDVLYPKNNVDVLPSGMYDKIRCVKKNLTEECLGIGDKIWDNVVSIARNRASLWSVRPQSTVFSEYFFAHTNADNKPNVTPYCLKRSSYIIL